MREGDYSIRARGAKGEDALGDVMAQVNDMAATLREQRLGALEATTLLRKVMEEIDVAIFAFDGDRKLKLVNRAGERLLAQPSERIMNAERGLAGLAEFLGGDGNAEHPANLSLRLRTLGHSSRDCFAKEDCRINCWWSPI